MRSVEAKSRIVADALAYWNPYMKERERLRREALRWSPEKAGTRVAVPAPAGMGVPFDWSDIGQTAYVPLWCELIRSALGGEYLDFALRRQLRDDAMVSRLKMPEACRWFPRKRVSGSNAEGSGA